MEPKEIIDAMKDPASLTPRNVTEYYVQLSAYFMERHTEESRLKGIVAGALANLMQNPDMTAAKARMIVNGSEDGRKLIKVAGEIVGLQEAIRSLKKMQEFLAFEARNQY